MQLGIVFLLVALCGLIPFASSHIDRSHPKVQHLSSAASIDHRLDEAILKRNGWTMLVGDSVLQQEFFAIAGLVQPSCSAMAADLVKERPDPRGFFLGAVPEYSLICHRGGPGEARHCEMRHELCLHLTIPEPCVSSSTDPFCVHNYHPLCDEVTWHKLADEATASDVEFALSFHWAPGPGLARRDPNIGDLHGDPEKLSNFTSVIKKRFAYRHPGAIVMNNCLHSWPYSWALPEDTWRKRLGLFLRALQVNLLELADAGFTGRFALQACIPLACNERFVWKSLDPSFKSCRAQNAEMMAVNAGTQRLLGAMQLASAFDDPWNLGVAQQELYVDGMHPCWTRPCSWTDIRGSPLTLTTPTPTMSETLKWSGFVNTDASLCLDLVAKAFAVLGRPMARFPEQHVLMAGGVVMPPVPSVLDLRASLFLATAPSLPALPPKPVFHVALPHPIGAARMSASSVVGMPGTPVGFHTSLPGNPGAAMEATMAVLARGAGGTTPLPAMRGAASVGGTALPSSVSPAAVAAKSQPGSHLMGKATAPLWAWVLMVLLWLMLISQFISDHPVDPAPCKTKGYVFQFRSVVENDSENENDPMGKISGQGERAL